MNEQMPHPTKPTPLSHPVWRVYLLVLLSAGALYVGTAQHGVGWQDSGEFQHRALHGEYANRRGLALAHPLYIAMCQPLKVFGLANLPTAMNMLSGVGMAVAVANVYLLGFWLTGRHGAAVGAAAMLTVAHTAWWLATIAEVYTWTTAGLTGELLVLTWLIVRPRWWKLALLGLLSGLGLALHNFALLPMPVHAVAAAILLARRKLPWWSLPAAAAAWAIGASPFLGMVVQHGLEHGDWIATARSALFGHAWADDVAASSLRPVGRAGIYILMNWPLASLAPVLIGWWVMPKQAGRAAGAALGAIASIHLIFAIRYPVPDQFTFLLPSYALFAIGAAVGLDRIARMGRRSRRVWVLLTAVSLAATPVLYGVTPKLLDARGMSIRKSRQWPYRNENRYWIIPWKVDEHSAEQFARAALQRAGSDAVIIPGSMGAAALRIIQQAEGLRPDVHIENAPTLQLGDYADDPAAYRRRLGDRPLYVMVGKPDPLPPALREDTVQTRDDELYPLRRVTFKD